MRDYHHLWPRSLYTKYRSERWNLLHICKIKHCHWHLLFGRLTLNEIIGMLCVRSENVGWFNTDTGKFQLVGNKSWQIVFGNKTAKEASTLLLRLRRMKKIAVV